MQHQLKNLLYLSKIDKKVFELKKANKDLPIRIQSLDGEISTAEKKLNEIVEAIKETEQKISENKIFGEKEQSALITSNERLESITTNKEYDAIHSEIATHKRNIEDAKASATHYQQILGNLKEDMVKIEEEYNTLSQTNSPELEKLRKELSTLEGRIEEEAKKGVEPRKKISRKVINIYDRISTRRGSPYIIAVIDWSHNVCENCNRTQPPQKINELSKMQSLLLCESCGSILIWREMDQVEEEVTAR